MKLHVLKLESKYYYDVMNENKKAELREDDRNYKVGDLIHFTDINGNEYEDLFNLFIITHILPCRSIIEDAKDYVILSITPFVDKRVWRG